jgi:hypothetical protein
VNMLSNVLSKKKQIRLSRTLSLPQSRARSEIRSRVPTLAKMYLKSTPIWLLNQRKMMTKILRTAKKESMMTTRKTTRKITMRKSPIDMN